MAQIFGSYKNKILMIDYYIKKMHVILDIQKHKFLYCNETEYDDNFMPGNKTTLNHQIELAKNLNFVDNMWNGEQISNKNESCLTINGNIPMALDIWSDNTKIASIYIDSIVNLPAIKSRIQTSNGYIQDTIYRKIPDNDYGLIGFKTDQRLDIFYVWGIYVSDDKIDLYEKKIIN